MGFFGFSIIFIILPSLTEAIPNLEGLSTLHNKTVASKSDFANFNANSLIDFLNNIIS